MEPTSTETLEVVCDCYLDSAELIELLQLNNELLAQVYTALLFVLGVSSAIFVCVILYKAIKSCY